MIAVDNLSQASRGDARPSTYSFVKHQYIVQATQHTMNSLSQFFSIVYTTIARSFETATSTYIDSYQRHPIAMADLPRRCHFPDHHHHKNVSNCSRSSSSPHEKRLQPCYNPYDHDTTHQHPKSPRETLPNIHDEPTELSFPARGPTSRRPDLLPSYTSPSQASTYLCTFCWRPQRAAVTPSRVVGRHARLACELCYNSLLDLAVC